MLCRRSASLHEQRADVILHGVKHLAIVVDLLRLVILLLLALGDNLDKKRHVTAETLPDILYGIVGILNHIMQKGCNHRIGLKHQFLGGNCRDGYGMQDIGFTRLTLLRGMGYTREFERIADTFHIF